MRMKIAAHTMGSPELTPTEAADLFAAMGYDGIEYVCQDGYKCGPWIGWSAAEREALRRYCDDKRLPIVCLTPYVTEINAADEAKGEEQVRLLRDCIRLAHDLGAPAVRLYGGKQVAEAEWEGSIAIAATRLQRVLGLCAETGVRIAVENHYGTITTTAAQTMALVTAVGDLHVGVLYDQANVTHVHAEDWQEAIRLQAGRILHVHAKDLIFLAGVGQEDFSQVTNIPKDKRAVRSVLLGEGAVPWPEIIRGLAAVGYDGYVSVEYTRKWYPEDLPVPEVGMQHSADYLRKLIGRLTPRGGVGGGG
jgi:sugar phosphate isomerase/epimerase